MEKCLKGKYRKSKLADAALELNGKIRSITMKTDNLEEVDGHQSTRTNFLYLFISMGIVWP